MPAAPRPRATPLATPYLAVLAVAGALLALLAWAALPVVLARGVAPTLADRDFVNYWAAARLAADHRAGIVFGAQPAYLAAAGALLGQKLTWHNWSYPPHYLLLMLPLAPLGYKLAMALFLGGTGLMLWAVGRAYLGRIDRCAVAALAPVALANFWTVQNGFLTASFVLGTLAWRDRRPVLAGLCLALATTKPQLALLLPVLLLVERRWRVLGVGAALTGLLVLASILAFGAEAWRGYLDAVVPYQRWVMAQHGFFLTMTPSVFAAARLAGVPVTAALAVHMAVAVPVLAACTIAFARLRQLRAREAVVLIGGVVLTPYALVYDLAPFAVGLVLLARAGKPPLPVALGMALPLLSVPAGLLGIGVGAPVGLAMLALALAPAFRPVLWAGETSRENAHDHPDPPSRPDRERGRRAPVHLLLSPDGLYPRARHRL